MLRNGATPAVIDFADQTLADISGTVIPAIISESQNDQTFINNLHARFEVIRQQLAEDNREVFHLNELETHWSNEHKTCRDVEHYCKCYGNDPDPNRIYATPGPVPKAGELEGYACGQDGKRRCEKDLYHLWEIWVEEEQVLRGIHDTISNHFCPPGTNGTLHTFRTQSIPWMESYMAQKIVVDEAEIAYDNKVPECVEIHERLDDHSAECNHMQHELQEAACRHEQAIVATLEKYYEDFALAQAAYNCAVEEVKELERDRHREWVTLQVVDCLLTRIRNQNGVPCDSETGVTEEVGICEALHQIDVCDPSDQFVNHEDPEGSVRNGEPLLCLTYPPIPPCPEFCDDRHSVVGVCLPVVQPTPCNADWDAQEMAITEALPGFPLAPFSHMNPGCNAYPECTPCPPVPVPLPRIKDTCPGYTIDGCSTSNSDTYEPDDLPLTFVRDVNGLADVRCCSTDGTQCASQDFDGGVDYNTPTGGLHTGCYFQVTYQEAMTVCHNAGMRICSVEEINQCCGTGCWHNHNKIWVNTLDDGAAMTLDERITQAEAADSVSHSESEGQPSMSEQLD
jgi:hypothetical protein